MSQTTTAPELEGSAFLFRQPELLTKEKHGTLGLERPKNPYNFCANVNAVPLVISEIAAAQKYYPVIFAENTGMPMAVVGLIENVNLFLDKDGEWEENVYIPSYIRRYPFALAGDKDSDRMAMIIDRAYEGFSEKAPGKIFDNGEASESAKAALEFCKTYEQEMAMTKEFGKKFLEYDLVTQQQAQFTPQGSDQPQPFAAYIGVDEQRLKDLADDKVLEMHKNGILPLVHAHLMSMGNWRLLMDRRVKKFNLTADTLMKPAV